jgi:hypothetical protein
MGRSSKRLGDHRDLPQTMHKPTRGDSSLQQEHVLFNTPLQSLQQLRVLLNMMLQSRQIHPTIAWTANHLQTHQSDALGNQIPPQVFAPQCLPVVLTDLSGKDHICVWEMRNVHEPTEKKQLLKKLGGRFSSMQVKMQIPECLSFQFEPLQCPVTAYCVHLFDLLKQNSNHEVIFTVWTSQDRKQPQMQTRFTRFSDEAVCFRIMPPIRACSRISLEINGPKQSANDTVEIQGLELSCYPWTAIVHPSPQ